MRTIFSVAMDNANENTSENNPNRQGERVAESAEDQDENSSSTLSLPSDLNSSSSWNPPTNLDSSSNWSLSSYSSVSSCSYTSSSSCSCMSSSSSSSSLWSLEDPLLVDSVGKDPEQFPTEKEPNADDMQHLLFDHNSHDTLSIDRSKLSSYSNHNSDRSSKLFRALSLKKRRREDRSEPDKRNWAYSSTEKASPRGFVEDTHKCDPLPRSSRNFMHLEPSSLKWSSANPSSSVESSRVSIRKRQNTLSIDSNLDIPSRKRRVSSAAPLNSYEVIHEEAQSPSKIIRDSPNCSEKREATPRKSKSIHPRMDLVRIGLASGRRGVKCLNEVDLEGEKINNRLEEIVDDESLDSVKPIYCSLIGCKVPLSEMMTIPLWINHVSDWFSLRGMKVVGDPGKMTERQIADIPTEGDPKVDYVREVLDKYADYYFSILEGEVVDEGQYEDSQAEIPSSASSSNISRDDDVMEIIEETIEIEIQLSEDINASRTSEEQNDQLLSEKVLVNVPEQLSLIRSSMHKISEKDHSTEIGVMELLGSEKMFEESCFALGLDEVLLKLSEIYSTDELLANFLSEYQMRIEAEHVNKYLNLVEMEKVLSERSAVQELGNFLLRKLEKEKKQDITMPLEDDHILSAFLKHYPRNVVINEVISNHEIIAPSIPLDSGVNNNSAEIVADTVLSQYPNMIEKISKNQVYNADKIFELCKSTKITKEQSQHIFEVIADHMNNDEFLSAISKIMKKRMKK